jgi:hypothetical protein
MVICEVYEGDIREYRGNARVLVTDSDVSESEYYFLKSEMLAKGYELISTRYDDNEMLSKYIRYSVSRQKEKRRSRKPLGAREDPASLAVVDRILKLRAAGLSLRAIQEDEGVRRADGKKYSVSTIAEVIRRKGNG